MSKEGLKYKRKGKGKRGKEGGKNSFSKHKVT